MNTPDNERVRQLIMASIDGEATGEQEQELQQLLRTYPEWAEEYHKLKNTKHMTSQYRLRQPQPELWDSYRRQIFTRIERSIGWILFTVGAVVLLAYGTWTWLSGLLTDPDLAWWVRLAIGSAAAGVIILLVSLVRERLFLHKRERYKDVER